MGLKRGSLRHRPWTVFALVTHQWTSAAAEQRSANPQRMRAVNSMGYQGNWLHKIASSRGLEQYVSVHSRHFAPACETPWKSLKNDENSMKTPWKLHEISMKSLLQLDASHSFLNPLSSLSSKHFVWTRRGCSNLASPKTTHIFINLPSFCPFAIYQSDFSSDILTFWEYPILH